MQRILTAVHEAAAGWVVGIYALAAGTAVIRGEIAFWMGVASTAIGIVAGILASVSYWYKIKRDRKALNP